MLLKQAVHKHWSRLDGSFEEPEVAEDEKVAVRAALLAALWAAPPAVRVSLGVCVAAIAKHDYPDAWPGVLDALLEAVRRQGPEVRVTQLPSLRARQQS